MAAERLDSSQREAFLKDGYLVIPGFFGKDAVDAMLTRAKQLIDEVDLESHPMTAFTTAEQGRHVGDQYFLDSSSRISVFFEPSALDPEDPKRLVVPKQQSINKIGHALCQLDPVFRKHTLANERLQHLARDLAVHQDPLVLQSMIICKQPRIGGKVPIHNDSTFLYTDPPSAVGFWIALEPCTAENGALSFLPGSHKRKTITKRFVRMPQGGTGFVDIPADQDEANTDWEAEPGWKQECCGAGDLVIIHGGVQHQSPHNLSEKTRFIYTFHMIEGAEGFEYDKHNWLQPSADLPLPHLLDRDNMP